MDVKGHPKRMVIGLWVLAALLILWYNGSQVTSLLDKPLPSLSAEARATITKWQRLENSLAKNMQEMLDPAEIQKIVAALDRKKVQLVHRAKKRAPASLTAKRPVPIIKSVRIKKKKVVLPVLSGIVASYNSNGVVGYLAVLDGKAREEKSRVGEFLLENIDEKGVVLSQGTRSWFIPKPVVDFSLDIGNTARNGGSE